MSRNGAAPGTPSMRGHNFELHGYGLTPTQCFICNEFLNGFWQEAYQCQNCAINVHDACRSQTTPTCFVTHRFKETSYMTIATCAACGQAMIGLWKQGFKCEDCGLDVHPQCRTQSSISACRAAVVPMEDIVQLPNTTIKPEDSAQPKRRSFVERPSSHKLTKNGSGSSSSMILPVEPLPTDLDGVKREMRKLHDECLASSKALDDQWEKTTKPALKAQRTQLQQQYDAFKLKQKEKHAEVLALSNARDDAFRQFLKTFYQKYNPSKLKNIDQVVAHYGNGTCRERELFSELLEKYATEPTAVAQIEHERDFGVLSAGALEQGLIEAEELASQVSKSKAALAQVRRDVYFAPNVPWLLKGGTEGVYAGFTSLWLEECIGLFQLSCVVSKGSEMSTPLSPDDDGYRPRISMQLGGLEGSNDLGWHVSARMEDMCLQGSGLPVALSLRDADLVVQFDLSMEAQYDPPTGPDDPYGSWRVLDAGFVLKARKFTLKTKSTGGLSIPDVVLSTILQTIIGMIFKKVIILLLPPELGVLMLAVHRHRTTQRKANPNQPEADAEVWQSATSSDPTEDRFLKLQAKINIKQTIELDAVDASITEKSLDSNDLVPKVLQSLKLDKDQFRLLLHTQKELGLTFGSLWGSQNADWLSSLATTVTGSGPDLNRIPLQSLFDLIRYYRDFLDPLNTSNGMPRHRKAHVAHRLADLWQLATDMVCENSGGEVDRAGIAGKMRRMVTQRLKTTNVNLKAIDFVSFRYRLGELAKQEINTEVEVSTFEVTLALRGLVRALRDAGLRVIGRKAGAFHARMAVLPRKNKSGTPAPGESTEVGKEFAQAVQQDRVENNNSLIPDLGKSLPVKIQRASDFVLDKLRELQERYVDSFRSRAELVAGDGVFRSATTDLRLVAPVDVGLQITSKLFGSVLSKSVKQNSDDPNRWMWNRKVVVEDGKFKVTFTRDAKAPQPEKGGMVDALRRMGGKAAQAAEQDTGSFTYTFSGLFAQLRTDTSAITDVLSFHLRPLMEPDRAEIRAVGANAMRMHLTIDKYEGAGQFATLFHYVDDFIAAIGKNNADINRLRVFPRFVASFAARDSFYIDSIGNVTLLSDHSAGDLVAHLENIPGKRCLRLTLTHYSMDVIHDLLDLLQSAMKLSPKEKA